MADVSMGDFLLQYYMQLRFNLMPAEVRAQYNVYAKSNDFRGNMKEWKQKLMHDDGNGNYVQNALPDPEDNNSQYHLSDAEWEKLFKAYQNAIRGMAAARANGDEIIKENPDAKGFLDEYFGDPRTHLFSNAQANPQYIPYLDELRNIFQTHPQLEYVLRQGGYTELSFSDLKSGLASQKYNSDPNFQSQLVKIIGFLAWRVTEDETIAGWFTTNNPALAIPGTNQLALQTIVDNAFADTTIDANKLNYFKRNHQDLLNVLYKKDKVFNVFRNYDSGKISGRIVAARDKLKYDDKSTDDYIPPKRDDELTPLQQLSRWADDTYDNLLDKYLKFHGDRLYFSKNAENIVKAINGAKIKPTDGIKGVLDKAEDIKKNLLYKSPTATKHFDWFTKTMGELQSTMKNAFAGALKNGRQMRAIVSELIIKAVRDGKVDEAKTAMEVLSVIKYGATTSKIMDALGKENMTIFSDSKLSWNKNEGVKFVSTALDKSIKAAFMGIGYGITIIGNEIRLSGSKFNGRRGRIRYAQTAWQSQTNQEHQHKIDETNLQNASDRAEIQNQQQIQQQINGTRRNPITDQNYDSLLSANGQTQQNLETRANNPDFQTAQSNINRYNDLSALIPQLQAEENRLQAEVQRVDQEYRNPDTYRGLPLATQNAIATRLAAQIYDMNTQLGEVQGQLQTAQNELNVIVGDPMWPAQQTIVSQYNTEKQQADEESAALNQWHSAAEAINELNRNITNRDNVLAGWDENHKDNYIALMAYWDMLETGRDSHMGAMYNWLPRGKKSAQTAFNQRKDNIISGYLSGYSYVA